MIAILITLLGRPDNIRKMIAEYKQVTSGDSELLFAIEKNDKHYEEIKEIIKDYRYIEGSWDGVCEKLQDMYETFKDDKFLLYHGSADDITYSKDFDKQMLEEIDYLESKAGHRLWVLYGKDFVHNQKLSTHWFVTKEYCDAVGYFTPRGYMRHCNTDVSFYLVALELGILHYVPWVDTHHHSWANGEAVKDSNFDLAYTQERLTHDNEKFQLWLQEQAPINLRKIVEAINAGIKR